MKDEQFIDYQDQIFQDSAFLLSPKLSLLKQLKAEENHILWKMSFSTTILVFFNSVFDSLVVTLTWLFSDREKRSLIWYLEQVREHSKIFFQRRYRYST
jgi:hypothetical protein